MTDPRELPVYETLDALGISYERIEHGEARTMYALVEVDAAMGADHCKNLFLCNRQGTVFYLLLLGGEKKFRTAEVSKQLGVARLSFASAETLDEYLGLEPGSVTPMGLINDHEHTITVLIDRDLRNAERIMVHPNVCTASICISGEDLFKFLASRGNPVVDVTIGGEEA